MPYKDKVLQKEAVKRAVQKHRGITQSITQQGITSDGTEMVPASYVEGMTGRFLNLPERPRYLTLSDGQVLDRVNQPSSSLGGIRMRRCNEAGFNFKISKGILPDSLKSKMTNITSPTINEKAP